MVGGDDENGGSDGLKGERRKDECDGVGQGKRSWMVGNLRRCEKSEGRW